MKFGSVVRRWLSAKERSSTNRLPTSRDYCTFPLCVFFPSVFFEPVVGIGFGVERLNFGIT